MSYVTVPEHQCCVNETSTDLPPMDTPNVPFYEALTVEPVWRRNSTDGRSLIRAPLPQKEARQRPMIAMATTEHAGGTA